MAIDRKTFLEELEPLITKFNLKDQEPRLRVEQLSLEEWMRIATMMGTPEDVKVILKKGVDLSATVNGMNAWRAAQIYQRDDILEILPHPKPRAKP